MTQVKEINIRKIKETNGIVAVANCVIASNDFAFYLDRIGIVAQADGKFRLSFPRYDFGKQRLNYYHPINKQTVSLLENAIIERFMRLEEAVNKDL